MGPVKRQFIYEKQMNADRINFIENIRKPLSACSFFKKLSFYNLCSNSSLKLQHLPHTSAAAALAHYCSQYSRRSVQFFTAGTHWVTLTYIPHLIVSVKQCHWTAREIHTKLQNRIVILCLDSLGKCVYLLYPAV